MTEQTTTAPRWLAVAATVDGFVLTDEDVRGWCEAIEEGKSGWGVPCEDPDELLIVTGSAMPVPQSEAPDEDIMRLPGTWTTEDRFVEVDVSNDEPEELLRRWERIQATAAAMNAADVP